MKLAARVETINESVTLALNDLAGRLAKEGKKIYNLTAGQLPFPPSPEFIEEAKRQLGDLKSFQYCPVPGFEEYRTKILQEMSSSRAIVTPANEYGVVVGNGAKQVLYNTFGTLLDPGDEAILLAPYWISYPEMVKMWQATPVVVQSSLSSNFVPSIAAIEKAITPRTKVLVINSPNNPSGVCYSADWMRELAQLLKRHPQIWVVSDEIYRDLYYQGERPMQVYQYEPSLVARTILVDGISKSYACTGLRIGYCLAPKRVVQAMSNLQAQTTSGANSLVQKSCMVFTPAKVESFLAPIKQHLLENWQILCRVFRQYQLDPLLYQTTSAFYYIIDFGRLPNFRARWDQDQRGVDYSAKICQEILAQLGVVMVPVSDFGLTNGGRISLVAPHKEFEEAMILVARYLAQ